MRITSSRTCFGVEPSGLNNISANTILDHRFQECFGFIEEEVEQILRYYGLTYNVEEVKSWYNGYLFGEKTIYNPWSIMNYTVNHRRGLMAHWVNTSDNELIEELVSKGNKTIKMNLEVLMSGNSITKQIKEDVSLRDLEFQPESIWSFLLFSGYLKAIDGIQDERGLTCKLVIPNKEVMYLYRDIISRWGSKVIESSDFEMMLRYLVSGEVRDFGKIFQEYVLRSMSYFDIAGNESEKVYHAFVLGMLVALSPTHKVKSNRESGLGRYDVMLIPRNIQEAGIIIEFKKYDSDDAKDLEEAGQKALLQIKEKNYKQELVEEGIEKIVTIGIVFKGKEVLVVEGK